MQLQAPSSKIEVKTDRVKALASLLQINHEKAVRITTSLPRLLEVTPQRLSANFEALALAFQLSEVELRKVARRSPDVLILPARTQSNNAEALGTLFDFNSAEIRSIFIQAPSTFGLSPTSLYRGAIQKCEVLGIELSTYRTMCVRRPSLIYQSSAHTREQFRSLQHHLKLDQESCRKLVRYAPELLTRKIEALARRLELVASQLEISYPQAVELIFVSRALASQRVEVLTNNLRNLALRLNLTPAEAVEMCKKEPRLMSRDPKAISANYELMKLVRGDGPERSRHAISVSPNHLLLSPERNVAHFFIRGLTGRRPVISLNPFRALAQITLEIDNDALLGRFDECRGQLVQAGVVRPDLLQPQSLELMQMMLLEARSCAHVGVVELAEILQAVLRTNREQRTAWTKAHSGNVSNS